ncbi:MAG: GTPase-associated system all-helical protein GASH [Nitrospirales bacterium]|nr:hypothetical protein [Nitrospirales bacterium]
MMHPNFYHWHGRSQLKPDVSILEPRWVAAEKFSQTLSVPDINALLRLVLFPEAVPDFAEKFSSELVKAEPTFPPQKNSELLRVMAAAVLCCRLGKSSNIADAFALGLQSADFPQGRIRPICQDIMTRSTEYLAEESERVRPEVTAGTPEDVETQTASHIVAIGKATESNQPQDIGKATQALGSSLVGAIKKNHQQLGEVIGRLAEESQFLWWLVSRRSSSMNKRRELLNAGDYALPAAEEAASRVALLPPAASVESLLREVLSQCGKSNPNSKSLTALINTTDQDWLARTSNSIVAPQLTPIAALIAQRKRSRKVSVDTLKELKISSQTKTTAEEASVQYFNELMFIRAIEEVS